MKRMIAIILVGVLVLSALAVYLAHPQTRLRLSLYSYTRAVSRENPDNMRLTVWYMDPATLTRAPVSVEELKRLVGLNAPGTNRISAGAEELAEQAEVLRKLERSALVPADETSYINARLHYEIEWGEKEILKVTVNQINFNAFVNGIEVKHDPVLYELIIPFLSEEDRAILGI